MPRQSCADVSKTVAMAVPHQSCADVSETVAMAFPVPKLCGRIGDGSYGGAKALHCRANRLGGRG